MRYRFYSFAWTTPLPSFISRPEANGCWLIYQVWRFRVTFKRVNGSITEFMQRYRREKDRCNSTTNER